VKEAGKGKPKKIKRKKNNKKEKKRKESEFIGRESVCPH
jgi:hypothetical protein